MTTRDWNKERDRESGKIVAEIDCHHPVSVRVLLLDLRVLDLSSPVQSSTTEKHRLVGHTSCAPLSIEQGVALTGRNTTGPPCSRGTIIRLEAA